MKNIGFIAVVFLGLILTACGFHLRNAEHFPPALRVLYLESENPYSLLHSQLAGNLRALNVRLVSSPSQAPITLLILKSELVHSNPSILSTNMAVPYTFTQITVVELLHHGQIIAGPQTLSASRTIVLNSNQILNSSIGTSARQEIIRDTISKLYFWLTSRNTQQALTHYANHRTRTQTTH
jgi:LPS-assembly lipoprotein